MRLVWQIGSHPSGALEFTTNHWQLRLALLLAAAHALPPLGRSAILRATKDQQRRIEPSFPSNIGSRPSRLSNTLNRKPLTFEHFRRLKRRGQHVEFRGHDD
jgi:hypothetical protein